MTTDSPVRTISFCGVRHGLDAAASGKVDLEMSLDRRIGESVAQRGNVEGMIVSYFIHWGGSLEKPGKDIIEAHVTSPRYNSRHRILGVDVFIPKNLYSLNDADFLALFHSLIIEGAERMNDFVERKFNSDTSFTWVVDLIRNACSEQMALHLGSTPMQARQEAEQMKSVLKRTNRAKNF